MAVTYGFFNSVNGDRKYNADTMSEFYTGICSQGVFQSVDNGLAVSAGTGLTVNVATGRAIIQGHWVKNDAALTLSIDAASATYARIDAVVIRYSASNRNIQIVVKTGTPAASPSAPSMTRAGGVYELCLAYVNVAANATSVTVTDKRSNTSVCGWAAVAQAISGTYEAMIDDIKTGFDGVVYNTPGDAVRGSDQELDDKIDDLKSTVKRFINSKNLLVMAPFVENKYYWGGESSSTSYSYFEVDVENGKTYNFGGNVRFISRANEGVSNTDVRSYTATATETLYFTLYNSNRSSWSMCESTVDISTVGTYDTPTINDGVLKQVAGTSESAIMSQKSVTNAIGMINNRIDAEASRSDIIDTLAFISPNLYDESIALDGYLLNYANGEPIQSANYITSDYIPVKTGDILHYQFDLNGYRYDSVDKPGYSTMRMICAYMWDKTYITTEYSANASSYTVPDGAAYVRITFNKSATVTNLAIVKSTNTTIIPYFEGGKVAYIIPKYLTPTNEYRCYKGVYSDEIGFTDLATSVKSINLNCVMNFSALPIFELGIKSSNATLLKITVTSTNLTIYDNVFGSGTSSETTYTHGLTIVNDIQIQAETNETGKLSLSICSNGEMYTIPSELNLTRADLGYPYFKITSGNVDYVSVSASAKDINKYIWIFGDSYLSNDSARWAYYLNQKEYDTYMIDAYSGETSTKSLQSLKNLLKIGHPSYIVWCLGMNDGSDDTTPSTTWKNTFDEVKYLCEIYNVVLVGATIPTVPSISHEQKNAYIKSLGIPYIDFAAAVGAQANGTWYSGMLSSDNVHPTANGARALYFEAITDFPQLTMPN